MRKPLPRGRPRNEELADRAIKRCLTTAELEKLDAYTYWLINKFYTLGMKAGRRSAQQRTGDAK